MYLTETFLKPTLSSYQVHFCGCCQRTNWFGHHPKVFIPFSCCSFYHHLFNLVGANCIFFSVFWPTLILSLHYYYRIQLALQLYICMCVVVSCFVRILVHLAVKCFKKRKILQCKKILVMIVARFYFNFFLDFSNRTTLLLFINAFCWLIFEHCKDEELPTLYYIQFPLKNFFLLFQGAYIIYRGCVWVLCTGYVFFHTAI